MKLPARPPSAPVACLVLAVALGTPVLAQTLAPINVTATLTEVPLFEVPASVDVLDGGRTRGDGRAQVNLSESLALVPGLLARDRLNQAQDMQLSVRGFGARATFGVRGVRLYVDGIPATMPDGQGQLSHIDLASVGRLEVLRGPFSVLYGNSSGGVLQVFTEEGQGQPLLGGSVATGSYGLKRIDIKASGGTGALGYVLSAGRLSINGYRQHSAAERDGANARFDWTLDGDRKLTLLANTLSVQAQDPLGLNRAQFDASPRSVDASATTFNTRKTVRQSQLGAVYEHRLDADNQLRLMVYGGERAVTQFQAIPTGPQASPLHPGGVIGLARNYGGLDARWTTRTALAQRPLEIVGGLAYDTMNETRRGWQNFQGSTLGVQGALRREEDNRVTSLDPYVQATWKPDARWTVNAGVRHSLVRFSSADNYIVGANGNDSGSVRYSATLPAAGVTYAPSEQWRVYAAAGRGFETPTFNELAYRSVGTGLNFALRPSHSDNLETGVKWRTLPGAATRMEATAAMFHTATQDEIVTQSNVGGRSTFQNAGATRRRGLELATSIAPARHWLAQVSYTLLDARYRDAFVCPVNVNLCPAGRVPAGNRIPGTARNALAAEMGWRPTTGWRAGADARYLSSVAVNDVNRDAAASFVSLGAHVGYVLALDRWRIAATARVDNLADRKYAGSVIVNEGNGRYFEPAAGRNYVLSLSASYRF
ncbi:MAG: TonB-dependent receptor [Polaromonas sp.]|uniref:TonB-dependent receptor family protein n=1 Tax=Polaromonas sp. TaxID=1869339 RepID=UPI0027361B1B|nr:TonB-dependent receptor [Polaromonas sp.]MDP2819093.1 TonB-dependent receptor [Polaromonas sp.]